MGSLASFSDITKHRTLFVRSLWVHSHIRLISLDHGLSRLFSDCNLSAIAACSIGTFQSSQSPWTVVPLGIFSERNSVALLDSLVIIWSYAASTRSYAAPIRSYAAFLGLTPPSCHSHEILVTAVGENSHSPCIMSTKTVEPISKER